jgi:hypothetical protein
MQVPAPRWGDTQFVRRYYCGVDEEKKRRLEQERTPDARLLLWIGGIPEQLARELGDPEGSYYLAIDRGERMVEHEIRYIAVWPLGDPEFPADLIGELAWWPPDGSLMPSIVGAQFARGAGDLETVWRSLEQLRTGTVFRRGPGRPTGTWYDDVPIATVEEVWDDLRLGKLGPQLTIDMYGLTEELNDRRIFPRRPHFAWTAPTLGHYLNHHHRAMPKQRGGPLERQP